MMRTLLRLGAAGAIGCFSMARGRRGDWRTAGWLLLCFGGLAANYALAAKSSATAPVVLGQIVVTAPQLPVLGLSAREPLQTVTATELRNRGVHTLGAALRLIPLFGGASGLGTASTNKFTNGGEENADLFDLTKSRVLILVNGQRWIQGFEGDTDLSTLPVAIIQRIEVYPARGAVAYGDGAISGVINIITVSDFTGGALSAGSGASQGDGHWDGQRSWANLVLGTASRSAGLTAVLSWQQQRPVFSADRLLTAGPLPGTGSPRESPVTPYGEYEFVPTGGPFANSGLCPQQTGGNRLCNLTVIPGTSGANAGDYRRATSADVFNTYPYHDLVMPLDQWGMYLTGFHDLGGGIKASASVFAGRRTASQMGPPTALVLGTTGLPISVSVNQPYNPFGIALDSTGPNANLLVLSRRMTEARPVLFNETSDTYRATFNLNGSFGATAASPWRWNLAYLWSASQVDNENRGRINLSNLALGLGTPAVCATVPGCVPVNLFGGPGAITPAMLAFIGLPEHNRIENRMQIWTATLSQSHLAALPAGSLALGFGYQHLARDGVFVPDSAASLGVDSAAPFVRLPSYGGGYSGNALWSQAIVPLVGGVHRLNLGAGLRLYHYSSVGTGHVGDLTLNFDATRTVRLQAGWAQGFRTPNLRELGQAIPGSPATVSDPCSNYTVSGGSPAVAAACAAAGVPTSYVQTNPTTQVLKIGNPVLRAERSRNLWLSATWQPAAVPGLSLEAAYYRIDIGNAINRPSPQQTLNDCYSLGDPAACADISRASSGDLTVISTQTVNGSSVFTDWLSGGADYDWSTRVGLFTLRTNLAWTHRYLVSTATPNGTVSENQAGTELGSGEPSGIPRWSGTTGLDWEYGAWTAGWQLRAIGPMTESCSDQFDGTPYSYTALGMCSQPDAANQKLSRNHLGTTIYHDVYAGYQFTQTLSVTAGIDNLFDKAPPISVSQPLHYDPAIYPAPGRMFYVSLHYNWG